MTNESDSKCRCYGEGCSHCTDGYGATCEECSCYLDEVPSLKVGGLRYCRPDGLFAMGLDVLDAPSACSLCLRFECVCCVDCGGYGSWRDKTVNPDAPDCESCNGTGRAKAVT